MGIFEKLFHWFFIKGREEQLQKGIDAVNKAAKEYKEAEKQWDNSWQALADSPQFQEFIYTAMNATPEELKAMDAEFAAIYEKNLKEIRERNARNLKKVNDHENKK